MRLGVAVDAPQYAALGDVLHYLSAQAVPPGSLLRVPLGRRDTLGLVWEQVPEDIPQDPGVTLRPVGEVLACLPPLGEPWLRLVEFTARYYQRAIGEVALSVLPGISALQAAAARAGAPINHDFCTISLYSKNIACTCYNIISCNKVKVTICFKYNM